MNHPPCLHTVGGWISDRVAPDLQFHPGVGVGLGKDHTLFALESGIVVFKKTKYIKRVSS